MTKIDKRSALRSVMPGQTKRLIDRLDAGRKYEPSHGRLAIARRLYWAMCAQNPDRLITLCDGDGRVLARNRAKVLTTGV